jgi:NADP-reducing hydrogenase subunit HndD
MDHLRLWDTFHVHVIAFVGSISLLLLSLGYLSKRYGNGIDGAVQLLIDVGMLVGLLLFVTSSFTMAAAHFAKKTEEIRPQNSVDGLRDVDAVLTTRELARMIKRAGINWNMLPEEEFDPDLIGDYTGAGVIFGVTGGVMEAAVRTAYNMLTGKELEPVEFTPVRGFEGIKEATVEVNGLKINLCVASSTKNAKIIMDQIKAGTSKYNFIEIMACPGGCINGGGQPFVKPIFLPNEDLDIMETYRAKRASVLYKEDEGKEVRRSHLNKDIQKLYADFLEKPGSHKSHKYLHTTYNKDRVKFPCK